MKILLTDYAWPDVEMESSRFASAGHELVVAPTTDESALKSLAADVDAIMTCWAVVSAAVIDASSRLRIVSRIGIGLDNIDVAHCSSRGIPVTNVPDYCSDEVAEHALALMFALARRIGFFHGQTKRGEYDLAAAPPIVRLRGKTLGVIGFGKIGRALAQRAIGMGVHVVANSRSGIAGDLPVVMTSLDELFSQSDFVSIHVPLTDSTRGLIGREALAKMKSTAFLINTSRGPIVDHTALAEAIAQGRLAGAGLDVHDPEPPDLNSPLYRDERVIATPHAAFVSVESLLTLRETAIGQVLDALAGRAPKNVVNPAAIRGH